MVPSLLSSARARRRHARSHDLTIPEDQVQMQQLIQARHLTRVPSGDLVPDLPPPVPELILPTYEEPSVFSMNLPLDPGAAVFVPRTRFGTATGSELSVTGGLEPPWSSLDKNEDENQFMMLEEDRRIWQERHEAGSLESTPPGEGRFERYL
ncbi:hypothetical protein B0A55_02990 [Friedmanniomyces simplex]|uniref:Uncharacterized protein n=1 Tax=Friedmanniomyces simplex TaxID=329884 RepID=A0A4U0XUM3_9PEZI|nr:hypothetical protein B0A55_02990 [Friedmanniomyces simplex]